MKLYIYLRVNWETLDSFIIKKCFIFKGVSLRKHMKTKTLCNFIVQIRDTFAFYYSVPGFITLSIAIIFVVS